jgi:hypothetical protein
MLKAIQNAAWVAAFAFLAAFVIGMAMTGSSQHSPPSNDKQPTKTENGNTPESRTIAEKSADHDGEKREDKKRWYDTFRERPTDWLLVLFNGLLVCATIALFISGEKVADSAKTSAVAAKDSADIAKQALIAGQRAFISVSYRPSAHKNIMDGKIYAYGFTPVWLNAGNTPTRNMENHINIRAFEKEIAGDWDFPNLWNAKVAPEKRVPVPLGASPKNTVDGQSVAVDIKTIQDVIDGKKFLYFWGSATYNDVFPDTERHVTRFAVQIVAGGTPEEPEHMSFSFPFLGKYNCSDEECKFQGVPANWRPRQMDID